MGANFGTLALVAGSVAAGVATGGLSLGAEAAAGGAASGAAASGAAAAGSSAFSWGTAATLASAGLGAYGQIQQGQAKASSDRFNAALDRNNAQIARENAERAGQAGEAQAGISEMKTRAQVGAIKANQAAGGVDVNTGSAVDVRSSAAALGELDAISIRSNAAREAYGYQQNSRSFEQQANLGESEAKNADIAGPINAAGTLLGGIGDAATNWAKWQSGSSKGMIAASNPTGGDYGSPGASEFIG